MTTVAVTTEATATVTAATAGGATVMQYDLFS